MLRQFSNTKGPICCTLAGISTFFQAHAQAERALPYVVHTFRQCHVLRLAHWKKSSTPNGLDPLGMFTFSRLTRPLNALSPVSFTPEAY